MFIGYLTGVKGHKLWYSEGGVSRSIISRDAIFKEDMMYMETSKQPSDQSQEKLTRDKQVEVFLNRQPADQEIEHEMGDDDQEETKTVDPSDLHDYQLTRDRLRRQIRAPSRYAQAEVVSFTLNVDEEIGVLEPQSYKEAMTRSDKENWLRAMDEEMRSLEKNKTWILVEKPRQQKLVGSKWIYKIKEGIPRVESSSYKARLVAKGFTQKEGVEYNEIYYPIVRHSSIRVLLSIVVQYDIILEQLDIKTTFLQGNLEEKIYMCQPEGYEEKRSRNLVCLLKKSLYGLKQSPR